METTRPSACIRSDAGIDWKTWRFCTARITFAIVHLSVLALVRRVSKCRPRMDQSRSGFAVHQPIERHAQLARDLRDALERGNNARVLPFPHGRRSHADAARKLGLRNPGLNTRRAYVGAQC